MHFKIKPDATKILRASLILAVALVAIEAMRWSSRPVLTLDGQQLGVVEPFPVSQYRERYLNKGWDDWTTERHQRQREMGLLPAAWTAAPKSASANRSKPRIWMGLEPSETDS